MNRYTLTPVPGATSGAAWTVRANGRQIGRLNLTAAYERGDDGRSRHAMYVALWFPIRKRKDRHPYATCRVWRRDPWSPAPLEVHMPQPWTDDASMRCARITLADLWLSGELRKLYHKVMEN